MKTEQQIRRLFALYYLALADSQKADDAAVPNKTDEWVMFIDHLIREGEIPEDAVDWMCPRDLEAEVRKDN